MNQHSSFGLFALCGLVLAALGSGCSHTTRYVTAEHWHSDATFFIAYTEYERTNFIVASTGSSTAHVMMCRAGSDNGAACRPQVAIDRLLNPDEDIPEPPPGPALEPEPAAEEPAPAEGGEAAEGDLES